MKKYQKIPLQRLVDRYFAKPFYLPFLFEKNIRARKFPDKIEGIALFRLSSIGDSILLLPAIKKLKEATKAKIVVVCAKENFPVFEGQRFIDRIILLDNKILNPFKALDAVRKIRKEKIDLVIDTTHSSNLSAFLSYLVGAYTIGFSNPKTNTKNRIYNKSIPINPKKHMVLNYLELIGILNIKHENNEDSLIGLIYSKEDLAKIKVFLGKSKKLAGIYFVANPGYKRIPIDNLVKIIEFIVKRGYTPVFLGSEAERGFSEALMSKIDKKTAEKVLNLSGKTDIKELFALASRLSFVVSNDGGPMHISAAMKVPTLGLFGKSIDDPGIGLFGSDDRLRYYPYNNKSKILYRDNIRDIGVEEIKREIKSILKRNKKMNYN